MRVAEGSSGAMQFDEVLRTFQEFFDREGMMKAGAMKNFPPRALYEGEDVRLLINLPGVDRKAVRDYFERHGLLELYDAIEKAR